MELELNSQDGRKKIVKSGYYRLMFWGFLLLLVNSGILLAFSGVSFFRYANLFLHIGMGIALIIPLFTKVREFLNTDAKLGKTFGNAVGRIGFWAMALTFALGIYLLFAGNDISQRNILYAHIAGGFFAYTCLISCIRRAAYNISVENTYWRAGRLSFTVFMVACLLPILSMIFHTVYKNPDNKIVNPKHAPGSLEEASPDGEDSVFFPSPAETQRQKPIDAHFLADPSGASCGGGACHEDVVAQWKKSSHSLAAISKKTYFAALKIAEKQRKDGHYGNYCAGCHEPARLFSGQTVEELHTAKNQNFTHAGITCNACHAISGVKSTIGNGAYKMERPELYGLMEADNFLARGLQRFLIHIDPRAHSQLFSKKFFDEQRSAFCSSCHKMTIDPPFLAMNSLPGLTEYDTWVGSSNAKRDVRAFYHLNTENSCSDCHMARIPSDDPGAKQDSIRDHSFRMHRFKDLNKSGKTAGAGWKSQGLSIEIFAASKSGKSPISLKNSFTAFKPGEEVALDVIVKAINYGHAFPAGAPGLVESWIEIIARDGAGKIVFQNGALAKNRELPKDVHKYGVTFQDAEGRPIHNAHGIGAAGVKHARFIATNGVDLARYAFQIPNDADSLLEISARLHYRKRESVAAYGNGVESFEHDAKTGKFRSRVLVENVVTVQISNQDESRGETAPAPKEFLSWNDYGLALLQRGDLEEAGRAFQKTLALAPEFYDGWINLSRVLLVTGRADSARIALEKIVKTDSKNPKGRFFLALAYKQTGEYGAAKDELSYILKRFSRDRAVGSHLAHIYMLEGNYERAGKKLRKIVRHAPDDPVAHFYLMHTYKKLKLPEKAALEEKLYKRFSNRFGRKTIKPPLKIDEPLRLWQVLPWTNYMANDPE